MSKKHFKGVVESDPVFRTKESTGFRYVQMNIQGENGHIKAFGDASDDSIFSYQAGDEITYKEKRGGSGPTAVPVGTGSVDPVKGRENAIAIENGEPLPHPHLTMSAKRSESKPQNIGEVTELYSRCLKSVLRNESLIEAITFATADEAGRSSMIQAATSSVFIQANMSGLYE